MCVCFGVHVSVHLARRTFLISRASGFSMGAVEIEASVGEIGVDAVEVGACTVDVGAVRTGAGAIKVDVGAVVI